MSLRTPSNFSGRAASDAAFDLLGDEILAERADALGRAWRKAEAALIQLRAFDPASGTEPGERLALVKQTADAVYAYFIQRELCGLRRHEDVIREYGIPRDVLVRLGSR